MAETELALVSLDKKCPDRGHLRVADKLLPVTVTALPFPVAPMPDFPVRLTVLAAIFEFWVVIQGPGGFVNRDSAGRGFRHDGADAQAPGRYPLTDTVLPAPLATTLSASPGIASVR